MSFDGERFPALAAMQAAPIFDRLGFHFSDADEGWAEISFAAAPVANNLYGIVHGGVWLFLADSAMGGALGTVCDPAERIITTQLDFRWLRGLSGSQIRARGRVIRRGRSVSHAAVSLFDSEGREIGQGSATYVILPPEGASA
ncbi:MAG: PaaI family thioesterase [Dehalococcoidia bacterium]|nr:PaaI family thioesterase [Dehalococcoidia bacterium]